MFCVNVPVLSEHIIVALPNVSTAGIFLTIAFLLTSFFTPIACTIVATAGSPSGIAATASDIAVISIESTDFPVDIPIRNIITHIILARSANVLPKLFNFFLRGVCLSCTSFIICAILPTSVSIPIAVTYPLPLPYVTKLEENTVFFLSPIPTVPSILSVFFSTASDSPVSPDSSTFKLTVSKSLISAGT